MTRRPHVLAQLPHHRQSLSVPAYFPRSTKIPTEYCFTQCKEDPRSHRTLNLPEFVFDFLRYLNVITEVHPERREELTAYLSLIARLGVQFPPPLFYEYHKLFTHRGARLPGALVMMMFIFKYLLADTFAHVRNVHQWTIVHTHVKPDFLTATTNELKYRSMNLQRPKRLPYPLQTHSLCLVSLVLCTCYSANIQLHSYDYNQYSSSRD